LRAQLWAAVDDEISMNDCDIYRWVFCFCGFTAWSTKKMKMKCENNGCPFMYFISKTT
jgi:hypothetical protein